MGFGTASTIHSHVKGGLWQGPQPSTDDLKALSLLILPCLFLPLSKPIQGVLGVTRSFSGLFSQQR